MKIVDRNTFLQMPKGTVFCKFPLKSNGEASKEPLLFGIGAPSILDGACGCDFFQTQLGDDLFPKDATGDDYIDFLLEMRGNLGLEVPFEHWGGRDGLFEDDSVGFAIFSREEVQEMINLLQEALRDGYTETNRGERE